MNCSNCDGAVSASNDSLTVTRGGDAEVVTVLCDQCTKGVLTLKIVLARKDPKGEFTFEGYLPVASVR